MDCSAQSTAASVATTFAIAAQNTGWSPDSTCAAAR
jgi:hypothetical protein